MGSVNLQLAETEKQSVIERQEAGMDVDRVQHQTGGQVLTIVGGRVVSRGSMSSGNQFPINGQQLMMQLESISSALGDLTVTPGETHMETETVTGSNGRSSRPDLASHKCQVSHWF